MARRPYVPNQLLSRLVGRRLNAVVFSMDYVILWFDPDDDGTSNVTLHCFDSPIVERAGVFLQEPDVGYGDALRAFIPEVVTATAERTGEGLTVAFASGTLNVHPTAEQNQGFEIAMLSGFPDGEWMCWRPGEDSFEDLA